MDNEFLVCEEVVKYANVVFQVYKQPKKAKKRNIG